MPEDAGGSAGDPTEDVEAGVAGKDGPEDM